MKTSSSLFLIGAALMALHKYLYSYCMVLLHFFYRIDGEYWVHQRLTNVRIVVLFKGVGGFTGMGEEDINTQINKAYVFIMTL